MYKQFQQILIVTFVLLSIGCAKNKSAQPVGNGNGVPNTNPEARNVYVACEGSFGSGNASLFIKDLNAQTEFENVYLNKNGSVLGDVFQSMQRIDDRFFLCINNSDKVVVVDASTLEYIGEISIPKPRYVLPVTNGKAYVSSLYSNKIYVIDPNDMVVEGTIDMPAQNTEGMVALSNYAYICTWDTACNKVYMVNTVTDKLADSFTIAGRAPHSVGVDRDGAVWVLSGNVQKGKNAALTRLAPLSSDVMQSYQFKQGQDPIKLVFNQSRDAMYFIGVNYDGQSKYNGVFKMPINQGALPTTPFIPTSGVQYYWGLGVDPVTDEVYVGDPKGFIQKGSVSVYDANGDQIRTFGVGIGPGFFFFDE